MDERKFESLREEVKNCRRCELCKTRRNTVFGDGIVKTNVVFVGEAPGEAEDERGLPFVGRSGQLLDRMLAAVDLFRSQNIYITNIIKCRPPGNVDPTPGQQAACGEFLKRQLDLIDPKLIVCVGRIAACSLIDPNFKVTKEHGKVRKLDGRYVMGTFHPAALLRAPHQKEAAFSDFIAIADLLKELHTSSHA